MADEGGLNDAMRQSKEHNGFAFMLSWGGYYAYKTDEGTYKVWRLLDLNQHVLHCALYKTTFDHVPTLDEAKHAERLTMHAPLAPMGMLDKKDQTYLGSEPLTDDDLDGYTIYLEAQGVGEEESEKLIQNIIGYSAENATRVHLYENPDVKGSIFFIDKTAS
ncbi:MAG TPA: hypothetical protein VLE73_00235 [Candidatus Saccharimonadales bacterium]|nr:hypothetical protein [Candidatus Saccharimonadales bacterium]